jgi:glycine betaine/choline ABC-type transport system substrate-binding protein
MNITTFKLVLLPSILGVLMIATLATTGVNAAENILNDAIHDYTGDTWGSFKDTATYDRSVYHTRTILDESYHDYVSQDVAQFNNTSGEMEPAEFAALEKVTTPLPWVITSERSW